MKDAHLKAALEHLQQAYMLLHPESSEARKIGAAVMKITEARVHEEVRREGREPLYEAAPFMYQSVRNALPIIGALISENKYDEETMDYLRHIFMEMKDARNQAEGI